MYRKILLIVSFALLLILGCSKIANNLYWDFSNNKINSLSNTTQDLLNKLEAPITIEVYSPKIAFLNYCSDFLEKYSHASKNVNIVLKQSLLDPSLATKLKIQTEHSIVVNYKNQQQGLDIHPADLNEATISNLILRTTVKPNQWLTFLTGHQEADPFDSDVLGMSQFTKIIQDSGMNIAQLNLAKEQQIPSNLNTLVVVNPQNELLPLEKDLIHNFLEQGGNLIWFTEPDVPAVSFLQQEFGIKLASGVALDPGSSALGSPHPALKIITSYPDHTITNNIKTPIIMPWSGHLIAGKNLQWQSKPFLTTGANTWTYTGNSDDPANFALHKGAQGPLTLGLALTRNSNSNEQHVLVIADSSFLLNKYLSLYANAQLAGNMLGWLQSSAPSLTFSPEKARDLSYTPNNFNMFLLRYGFTILLPLLLVGMGYFVTLRKT